MPNGGDDREMGRLEAKVDMLMDLVKGLETKYVTKAEYEPRIKALEERHTQKWAVLMSVSSLGAFAVSVMALLKTFH